MTIPKIELIVGDRNTEGIVLKCTGCAERYIYSWRQWKSDFTDSISEFEQFLQWAKRDAAQHECFLAGRMGYLPPDFFEGVEWGVAAAKEGRVTPWEDVERHEDPFGERVMAGMPLADYLRDDAEDDLEDDWIDLGADDDEDEPDIGVDDDRYDWEEVRFDFLYGEPTEFKTYGIRHPTLEEVPRLRSFPPIEINYADLERRMLDGMLFNMGIYTKDAQGNLRDEKGRCLACLRAGVHR